MTESKHNNGGIGWTPILVALIVGLGVVVVLWAVTGQADDLDKAERRVQTLEDKDALSDKALAAMAVQVEKLCGDRPNCEPIVAVDPDAGEGDLDDLEIQDLEIQDLEIQQGEVQEPEEQEPESNDPDPDDPETQEPENQDGEVQDPEVDDPEAQDEEFDDPENQEPEIQEPEQQDPEQQDPEIDDPDPNDEMDTFTFEWMGSTWTCTDTDNDRHWTCTAVGPGPEE